MSTSNNLRTRAKALYDERQANGGLMSYDHMKLRARARRLARQVSRLATHETDSDMAMALMYLDTIAIREGITLLFAEDI